MNTNIFLPKKIKVGFNTRSDTYTKKLGYVIYHDGKVWRKEASWEGWREHVITKKEYDIKKREDFDSRVANYTRNYNSMKEAVEKNPTAYRSDHYYHDYLKMSLEEYLKENKVHPEGYVKYSPNLGRITEDTSLAPVEFENIPLEGFVLNKGAGGAAGSSSSWNTRRETIRVYDPRGFEFEISVANLLYILENTNSYVGKGLEGKCIYGWQGKDLVLIPENAPEYKEMLEFNALLEGKVAKKDLVEGNIYITSQNQRVVFLEEKTTYCQKTFKPLKEKVMLFYTLNSTWEANHGAKYRHYNVHSRTAATLKKDTGEKVDNYADLHAEIQNTREFKTPAKIATVEYFQHTQESLEKFIVHNAKEQRDTNNYYGTPVYVLNRQKKYTLMYLYKTTSGSYYDSELGKSIVFPIHYKLGKSSYNPYRYKVKKEDLENAHVSLYNLLVETPLYMEKLS